MKNKKRLIVFVGPVSSGKSILSKSLENAENKRLDFDELIIELGNYEGITYDQLFAVLEHIADEGEYKILDIGGGTFTYLDSNQQERLLKILDGATIFYVRPFANNKKSFRLLSNLIAGEKGTERKRKKELMASVYYDLENEFYEKLKTEPTINILDEQNNKGLGNVLVNNIMPLSLLRSAYYKEIIKYADTFKKKYEYLLENYNLQIEKD